MPTTTAGIYQFEFDGDKYYVKGDIAIPEPAAWEPIQPQGTEGGRHEAVFTGKMKDIRMTIYDSATGAGSANFQKITDVNDNAALGDLATASYKTAVLRRISGNSVSVITGNAIIADFTRNQPSRDGSTADIVVEYYTAPPALV